jgi:hypothetical protein
MKKLFIPSIVGLSTAVLLSGCVLNLGGGRKTNSTCTDAHPAIGQQTVAPTTGQQLIDLQKAKDAGVITDAEYQAQKAKLLDTK